MSTHVNTSTQVSPAARLGSVRGAAVEGVAAAPGLERPVAGREGALPGGIRGLRHGRIRPDARSSVKS